MESLLAPGTPLWLAAGVALMGLITFGTRIFPFRVFRNHTPGPRFRALQERLPALVLVILTLWALKDLPGTPLAHTGVTLGCLALAVGLHAWRRNALVSIFVPTVLYMVWMAFSS